MKIDIQNGSPQPGSPTEPYCVPHGKTIHIEHHRDLGTMYTRRKYINDESPR